MQYNGGFLPDIILLTQGYYHWETRLNISVLVLLFFWCPCMAINLSVQQYNGGLLHDIILLSQCYFHRGTHLNTMKKFCICSL